MLIIDVREPDEFAHEMAKHTVNLPLSQWKENLSTVSDWANQVNVAVVCASGVHSKKAYDELIAYDKKLIGKVSDLGSFKNLEQAESSALTGSIPIMRQVMIVVGVLLLALASLSFYYSNTLWAILFIGTGLLVAGLTGFCLMGKILAKMPWN